MKLLRLALVVPLTFLASGVIVAGAQVVREPTVKAKAYVEDGLYRNYLQPKGFSDRGSLDHGRAFNPKTGQNAHWDAKKWQWIDSKTGEPLSPSATEAKKEAYVEDGLYRDYLQPKGFSDRGSLDHGRAFNPKTGQNAHWDAKKWQWIDSKTGEPLSPAGATELPASTTTTPAATPAKNPQVPCSNQNAYDPKFPDYSQLHEYCGKAVVGLSFHSSVPLKAAGWLGLVIVNCPIDGKTATCTGITDIPKLQAGNVYLSHPGGFPLGDSASVKITFADHTTQTEFFFTHPH